MSYIPPFKGGQGRSAVDLLEMWPGIYRIVCISLVITCGVLAYNIVTRAPHHTTIHVKAR